MKKILFICSGNSFRSRFSEALFNHTAKEQDLDWEAFSRGLKVKAPKEEIAAEAEALLKEKGIDLDNTGTHRMPLTEEDLKTADKVVALKKDEHHPLMVEKFPQWAEKITYWDVHDLDPNEPDQEDPLVLVEKQVLSIFDDLQ